MTDKQETTFCRTIIRDIISYGLCVSYWIVLIRNSLISAYSSHVWHDAFYFRKFQLVIKIEREYLKKPENTITYNYLRFTKYKIHLTFNYFNKSSKFCYWEFPTEINQVTTNAEIGCLSIDFKRVHLKIRGLNNWCYGKKLPPPCSII